MTDRPTYLAVDPGTTGALALLHDGEVTLFDIPYTETITEGRKRRVLDLEALADVCRLLAAFEPLLVTERVSGRRGDDAWSIGELTRSAGAVEAALAACGVPVAFRVMPGVWKRALGLTRIPKADRKHASLDLARRLFPRCDQFKRAKDHNRAEAALIAHWTAATYPSGIFVADGQQDQASAKKTKRRKKKQIEDTKNVFC